MIDYTLLIKQSSKIYDKYVAELNLQLTDSAILIGSSPSISCYELEDSIDNYNGCVIRINRPAQSEYVKNYGKRADFYFTHQRCELLDKLDSLKPIIRITTEDKLKTYKLFNRAFNVNLRWTTGFQAIIFSLCYFKNIELFGFGTLDESFKYKYENLFISTDLSDHDIKAEHVVLQQIMADQQQLHRIEDDKSKIA